MRVAWAWIGLSVSVLACGSGGDGSGGAGDAIVADGAAGEGGAGGGAAGASGAAGDGGGAGADAGGLPSCLQELASACTAAGACTVNANHDAYCFANGVHVTLSGAVCSASDTPAVFTVTDANGAACYSVVQIAYYGHACEDGAVTWRSASGDVVATGTFPAGFSGAGTSVACKSGAPGGVCSASACPGVVPFSLGSCTVGECGDAADGGGGADGGA